MAERILMQSPRLKKWLKAYSKRYEERTPRVYRTKDKRLYIGHMVDDWFYGTRLLPVIFKHPGAGRIFCFCGSDLTELRGFWKRYEKQGICAIDPRHSYEVMDGWQRFPSVGRRQVQRQCSCCGFAQVKEVRIRRVREETWTKVPTVGRGSR